MDKLSEYRQITKAGFSKYAEILRRSTLEDREVVLVFDEESDNYLLLKLGWKGYHRLWGTSLHIRIRDGKFWIEEDGLEEGFATDLLEAGVPKDDIVLAFHHPKRRPYTEFAVA